MWLALLAASALAEIPLPDYDRALARREWIALNSRLDATCAFSPATARVECRDPEVLDEVIARATRWQRAIHTDPGLTYLVGLANRYKGFHPRARRFMEEAVHLDPDYRAPWYDLGEICLLQGDLECAEHAFEQVDRLTPDGEDSWIAPWRLAEVAAFRRDPEAFEAHVREALRRGFTFDRVVALPNWQGFARDPQIGPSVEKLVSVYGSPRDLEVLRGGAPR